jgi:transcriptional regulator of arginine metabolism
MHMEYSSTERRRILAELLRSHPIASQEELAERLAAQGHAVTQATISRDLEQVGAVKVRRAGRLSYTLPDQARETPTPRLDLLLQQWVSSIDTAMNLLVIRTPPGSAHLIGVALDHSDLPGKVGTICGDDTLFVACRSVEDAEALARSFRGGGLAAA